MNEVERKWKSKGTITIQVSIPIIVWEEWNDDCLKRFNGTRYLKMLHDHQVANNVVGLINIMTEEVDDLRREVARLTETPSESEKPKKKTFGKD